MKNTPCAISLVLLLIVFALPHSSMGAGVVTSTTEENFRAALAGGGTVTFAVSGTITFASTIVITNDTVIDGTGQTVIFDGNNSVRLFDVGPSITLTINQLTLTRGRFQGAYNPAGDGFEGSGGAVLVTEGTLNLQGCNIWTNTAVGGLGRSVGLFGSTGSGGPGSGGAIQLSGGTLNATDSEFIGNKAVGGSGGGAANCGGIAGTGGSGGGGAICNSNGILNLQNCVFIENTALGGFAPFCTLFAGAVGQAFGGALLNSGSAILSSCMFDQNITTASTNISVTARLGGQSWGGAIHHATGLMTLSENQFLKNSARGGDVFFASSVDGIAGGGAIRNLASLEIIGCSFSENQAAGGTGSSGANADGGALRLEGPCIITNSTLTANQATEGAGATSRGGAIFTSGTTSTIVNVTLVANGAASGRNLYETNSVVQMVNTIVAGGATGNNVGVVTDWGYNLSSDLSCAFSASGSLNNTDPRLGPFGNYGGPTPTVPLLAGSPAINGANNTAAPTTDQRGRARPFGGISDIGAFESSPPYVIAGRIAGQNPADAVFISKDTQGMIATNGAYRFDGSGAGMYTLTPSNGNYVFAPNSRMVTVGPDTLDVNFNAYRWNTVNIVSQSNGIVRLLYAGTNGQTHRLLVSSNLTAWSGLVTNTVGPSNYFEALDPDAVGKPVRLYRTVSP